MKMFALKPIIKFSKSEFHEIDDKVAIESILSIWVNDTFISSILCSPSFEKELAVGYLFTIGIITSYHEISRILHEGYDVKITLKSDIDLNSRLKSSQFINRVISSGCGPPEYWLQIKKGQGLPRINSTIQISIQTIFNVIGALNKSSEIFRETGATHAAGIYDGSGQRIITTEDIGRHNAVDKSIGFCIINGINMNDKILVSTGRLTADVVFKSARCQIPIVASMAAATDSGISTAQATNITLIGFVRGKQLNIYTQESRIEK